MYKFMYKAGIIIFWVTISFVFIMIGVWGLNSITRSNSDTKEKIPCNWTIEDSVKHFMDEVDIRFPEIVYNQAVLESNNFKSPLFKRTRNMFGMRVPGKRRSVAVNWDKTSDPYSVYTDWKMSIVDYKLWQESHNADKIKTEYGYLMMLVKSNYAQDGTYVNKIKR